MRVRDSTCGWEEGSTVRSGSEVVSKNVSLSAGLNEKCPPRLGHWEVSVPAGAAVWEGLGGAAFLKGF